MFGKGYNTKCPTDNQMNMMQYLGNGRKIFSIEIDYSGTRYGMIPDGFRTVYEKYSLSVGKDARVTIKADYYPGVVRGLDSLSQLIQKDESTESDYRVRFAPINIHNDEPSYPYRGVMLDTAKEYYYPDAIKQMLDGMLIARLNVFHWHFIDSDSISMQMKSYPNLTNYTAFRPYEIYTPDMVKDIVKHAKVRGITVIPELEGPAKLNSLGYYPEFKELISCFKDKSDKSSNNGPPPSAAIDPVSNKTYEILKNFMKDIKDSFEPSVWHLGGDEVEVNCWNQLSTVRNHISSGGKLDDLKNHYTNKEKETLKEVYNHDSDSSGYTRMYWYDGDRMNFEKDDILQLWGNTASITKDMNSERDNRFVLSPKGIMTVDCGYPDFRGSRNSCGSTISWKNVWNFDPDSYNSKGNVLGSEVISWSEMSNEYDFLTKIFPHAAVMSYKHWNTKGPNTQGEQIEMMMRFQYRVKAFGVPTAKISMRYCEEHTHHCFGI